jgi:hypothetical protein
VRSELDVLALENLAVLVKNLLARQHMAVVNGDVGVWLVLVLDLERFAVRRDCDGRNVAVPARDGRKDVSQAVSHEPRISV